MVALSACWGIGHCHLSLCGLSSLSGILLGFCTHVPLAISNIVRSKVVLCYFMVPTPILLPACLHGYVLSREINRDHLSFQVPYIVFVAYRVGISSFK